MFGHLSSPVRPGIVLGLLLIGEAFAAQAPATLKSAYHSDFMVGAAINEAQFTGKDAAGDAIITTQFNTISPENVLKWENIHPRPDKYNFAPADEYVDFGRKHNMYIVGHVLVWHSQTPDWVFHDSNGNLLSREALLDRLHDHIATVVGRYQGRIQAWDVVNEAIDEDGNMRKSLWFKIIGPDYVEKAFEFAHEADPAAELIYNDYNLENQPKRDGALTLVKRLLAEGIPIRTVGIQDHDHMDWPRPEQEDAAISAFGALGLKVSITELDINVLPMGGAGPTADVSLKIAQDKTLNPYADGLPDEMQQRLAARYAELFRVYMKHRSVVERVTFWCVADGDSWLNDWPVQGRKNYPLLFDRKGKPKLAYHAVIEVASEARRH